MRIFKKVVMIIIYLLIVFASLFNFLRTFDTETLKLEMILSLILTHLTSISIGLVGLIKETPFIKKIIFKLISSFKGSTLVYSYKVYVDEPKAVLLNNLYDVFKNKNFEIVKFVEELKDILRVEIIHPDSKIKYTFKIEYTDLSYQVSFNEIYASLKSIIKKRLKEINSLRLLIEQEIKKQTSIQKEKYYAQFYYNGKNPFVTYVMESSTNKIELLDLRMGDNFRLTKDVAEINAGSPKELEQMILKNLSKLNY